MDTALFLAMRKAIFNYINSKIPKEQNKAHIGTVSGNRVIINSFSYPYIPTVDMYFGDGDKVACIRPENTNAAVVVGVL